MDTGLRGRAVLVAGASRGIGRSIALAFAAEGANVAIIGRNPERLAETASDIRARGVDGIAVSADLARRDECRRAVDEAVSAFGGLGCLVTNAAVEVYASAGEASDEVFARLDGKVRPAVWCVQAAVPAIQSGGGGSIVCISGTSARQTYNDFNDHSFLQKGQTSVAAGMGNAAIVNFAKHLSDDLGPSDITVNVVHPGLTRTDRFPGRLQRYAEAYGLDLEAAERQMLKATALGRVVEPEEVASIVVFLASAQARAITGQSIAVDAGGLRGVAY